MISHLRPAILMLAIMTLLTGIAYPLAITGIGQLAFNYTANGSLATSGNKVIGSGLIGQAWTSGKYFWGRPSAAGNGYDASNSSGSNLGPTSQKLIARIKTDAARLHQSTGTPALPADAVTASGSGLDPHISPEFAMLQVARVAKARGVSEDMLIKAVSQATEGRQLGFLGEPRVNVLVLNLELDRL